jgi:sugar/nucleoside kinase (ribokinase family)
MISPKPVLSDRDFPTPEFTPLNYLRYNISMLQLTHLEPIDYLVIGHLTCDITPAGYRLGGTAAYSALTARSLGLRVGVVSAWGGEIPLTELGTIPVISYPAEKSTTFKNVVTSHGREQTILNVAPSLDLHLIPEPWRSAPIVHLGPVAQEVEPGLVRNFPSALIGVTPQGWMRTWDKAGKVTSAEWPEAAFVLERAGAAVISIEDVAGDEERVEEMAASSRILAVTEAHQGARLYWNGDVRRFRPPELKEVDATGAGDIFAAAFFARLYTTRDPWEAARFATLLSAQSISRIGLDSIPTQLEIQESLVEVF